MADKLDYKDRKTAAAIQAHALSYPEAVEDFPWGHSAFKVKGKAFVFMGAAEGGAISLSVKLPQSRDAALGFDWAEPTGYGLGKAGWVSATFPPGSNVPIDLLKDWIEESYRAVAPKTLAKRLDGGAAAPATAPARGAKKRAPRPKAKKAAKKPDKGASSSDPDRRPKGRAARKTAPPAKKKPAAKKQAPKKAPSAKLPTKARVAVGAARLAASVAMPKATKKVKQAVKPGAAPPRKAKARAPEPPRPKRVAPVAAQVKRDVSPRRRAVKAAAVGVAVKAVKDGVRRSVKTGAVAAALGATQGAGASAARSIGKIAAAELIKVYVAKGRERRKSRVKPAPG